MTNVPLDLTTVQQRLSQSNGRDYWRGLEELAETAEFQDFLHREFPRQASEWLPTLSRRNFLQLMGASLALAGLTACSNQPDEKIVPYVQMPEETVPGQPLFFATAMQLGGYAMGLLAQSQLNRPTKVEGNPDHPASLGATDALAQASILNLYDPDRAKAVTHDGAASSWEEFLTDLQTHLAQQQASGGAGLRILTETVTSPTLVSQLQALLTQFPNAVWHQYEPVNRDNVYAGAQLAFGEAVEPIYQLDQADVIVSLEADLFGVAPGRVRYARDFADGRRVDGPAARNRNRLYVIESSPTITGAAADHRLALKAGQVEGFARVLAVALGLTVTASEDAAIPADWISAIAQDLQAHPGASLVVAGEHQPAIVHALAHAINDTLGNGGQTVIYSEPVVANPGNQTQSLRELVDAMTAGQVELLLIWGQSGLYGAGGPRFLPRHWRMSLGRYARVPILMRPLSTVSGKSRNPTIWKRGVMAAPTTARSPYSSR
ncbi:MAG: TAT-variant-translocated molybdopterin oxidoreductase [Caldilineaceae bacterium]